MFDDLFNLYKQIKIAKATARKIDETVRAKLKINIFPFKNLKKIEINKNPIKPKIRKIVEKSLYFLYILPPYQ